MDTAAVPLLAFGGTAPAPAVAVRLAAAGGVPDSATTFHPAGSASAPVPLLAFAPQPVYRTWLLTRGGYPSASVSVPLVTWGGADFGCPLGWAGWSDTWPGAGSLWDCTRSDPWSVAVPLLAGGCGPVPVSGRAWLLAFAPTAPVSPPPPPTLYPTASGAARLLAAGKGAGAVAVPLVARGWTPPSVAVRLLAGGF